MSRKERTVRICPLCKHHFKLMTDNQWKHNLFQHLLMKQRHKLTIDEAKKIVDKEFN